MPIISRFYGIVVYIYWRDHTPPHFHAKYQDEEVAIDIETGHVKGIIPPRALAFLQEWRGLHIDELMENWNLASQSKQMRRIDPLE